MSQPGFGSESRTARSIANPPSPPGLPWLGNLPGLVRHGAVGYLSQQWKRHGDTFLLRVGDRRMVVLAHPDSVAHVLAKNAANYRKEKSYENMRVLTGDGLLTLEGEAWRKRRRLAQPSFHRAQIDRLTETMTRLTQRTLDRWRSTFPKEGVIDAHEEMLRLALEIVGEALFGQALNQETSDSSVHAFSDVLRIISERGNAPVQLPLHWPTPDNLRLKRALATLDRVTYQVIEQARRTPSPHTLLGTLIAARDADTGEALRDEEIRNEVVTLFVAGHETTALALSWGFALLGHAPEVVARMRDEVRSVLGDRPPTAADIPRLVYVRQVIDEILRLRCPVWTVARDTQQDDEIGGFRIRAGDIVLPSAYLTHRHPDFWDEPERFDPERFTPERVKERPQWAYYPFSLGQRMCIGNTFSLVESQVVLALLLQQCDFELVDLRPVPQRATFTLRPGRPIKVRIRFRS